MFLYTLRPNLTLESTTTLPGGAGGDRFMGELSAAPNGRLDASFWDRSYSGNQLEDLTYATSSDGGQTWRQAKVTPFGYDPSQWGVPSGEHGLPPVHRRLQRHRLDERVRRDDLDGCGSAAAAQPRNRLRTATP